MGCQDMCRFRVPKHVMFSLRSQPAEQQRAAANGMVHEATSAAAVHTGLIRSQNSCRTGWPCYSYTPITNAAAAHWLLRQAHWLSLTPQYAVQSLVGQLPKEKRRRLSAQPAIQTDPGADGIAIGLDGHVYSDTAITDAVAQVGQLGPLNPKVAVCHFPPQDRSQWQASSPINIQACRLQNLHEGLVQTDPFWATPTIWRDECTWLEQRGTHALVHTMRCWCGAQRLRRQA